MKFHFCQNDGNEKTPAMSFILVYFMKAVIRDWWETDLKIFHVTRNEILCKHPLNYSNFFDMKLTTLKYDVRSDVELETLFN